MSAQKINIAVVGYGHWGRNYVRNFGEIPRTRVRWVCDLDSEGLSRFHDTYPHIQVTRELTEVLKDAETRAVVISTTANTHHKLVKLCLEAGKDVLVEKPIALTVEQAEELAALAQKTGRILMVGHTFLYNPAVLKLKELLDAGEVGSVYYLKAVRSHMGLIREDVNVSWDLATHDVSILNFLLGSEPSSAHAFGLRFLGKERDDAAFITLRYGPERIAHVHVSWADANKQRLIEIVGSKGRMVFDDLNTLEPVRLFRKGISIDHDVSNFGEYKYLYSDGDIISPRVKMQEPLRLQCEHFVDCLTTKGSKPRTDAANGLSVVRTMCRIDSALAETRAGR